MTQKNTKTSPSPSSTTIEEITLYRRFLVALDSSQHANQGLQQAIDLAGFTKGSTLTGIHVYAAQLHDDRFRQMEGGLPEQFRKEEVLEEQRDVHDSLITRGLDLITQSYLDVGQRACDKVGLVYDRLAPEGKNYRELARATEAGEHDLLVLGAQGVGAVPGESLGGVCERVIRRTAIDALVVRGASNVDTPGPIVVAVDGSAFSYGGLLLGLALGRQRRLPVILAAAYDPYYHYVVFNNITKVLSKEGAEVFKFEEQEKLHEEIIDSGLAKIYQAHLDVGKEIATDYEQEVESLLLVGKPAAALAKLVKERGASLLILGKTGIHADDGLDIGRVTETLLREVACDLLITLRQHIPEVDRVASFTTSWSEEAEKRMERVPVFARKMARMAILRYAQDKGHTVITESIVEEATAELMPSHAAGKMAQVVRHAEAQKKAKKTFKLGWSAEATAMVDGLADHSMRANVRLRAEKAARRADSAQVLSEHVTPFIEQGSEGGEELGWSVEAEARLQRVPEGFMRDATRKSMVAYAKEQQVTEITLEVAEAGIARAKKHMMAKMAKEGGHPGGHPGSAPVAEDQTNVAVVWTEAAQARLDKIPLGMSRDMSRQAIETIAIRQGLPQIDEKVVTETLDVFKQGSATVRETMPWQDDARAMLSKIPDMVRGMLVQEIEGWVGRQGLQQVEVASVTKVFATWQSSGKFHLDPDDSRNE